MKKIIIILTVSALVLFAGTSVAYYNTSSLGYDNANLFELYEGGFRLLEFDINYKEIRNIADEICEKMPDKFITI